MFLVFGTLVEGQAQSFVFDFNIDNQQFSSGVSDYGVNQWEQIEYTYTNTNLRPPLDTFMHGQYISGINPSDDLFMFLKRHITGLQPNTKYEVTIEVEFASPYPTNAIGVGGAPGEGVTMKAGMTQIEPDTTIINKGGPFVIMNIDKGNQSNPGTDMDTIGHVGVNDTTTVWALKTNHNLNHPFLFTTDNTGSGWLIVGTDSGFESKTELFYTKVTVQFTPLTSVGHNLQPTEIHMFPNPSFGKVNFTSDAGNIDLIRIYDMMGRLKGTYLPQEDEINLHLPAGIYYVNLFTGQSAWVSRLMIK